MLLWAAVKTDNPEASSCGAEDPCTPTMYKDTCLVYQKVVKDLRDKVISILIIAGEGFERLDEREKTPFVVFV